ncbi:hypothetical protein M446_2580 [Methylobacterium sp. 4-46]|uniref:hypothetical protein n=1 Tax=unclassified Methylobacterium TaxID=2615210 RepID=UPI000152C59C|nr:MULTISPECIES: hypothetical protein [Methylobacterium]ACA17019.1 hypothetical protein M446_2580 [Methylobacterium sp. 4-46]WFT82708.1 hypothetical protein QA634_13085 [Methylobacterium nodulans]
MLSLPYDVPGTLLAGLLAGPVLLGPGALLAQGLAMPGWQEARTRLDRAALALLAGLAGLPVLLDLAGRLGPGAMVAAALALAVPGTVLLARPAPDPVPRGVLVRTLLGMALYAAFATLMLVDWPVTGGALRSVLMADYVKHAAATWAIAEAGTPPYDPTFLTAERPAVYYYFFYTLTAAVERLGLGAIAGRQAAFGLALWTGPVLFALARTVYAAARLDRPRPGAWSIGAWLVLLLLTTGLDILGVAAIGVLSGGENWLADFEQWNEQVAAWLTSALWVPHHVAGLVAAMVGLMALAAEDEAPADRSRSLRRVALAGLAFASLAGLSIYLAIGAAATLALWLGRLAWRRRWASVARGLLSGALALALAGAWLASILRGRVLGAEPPLALQIRKFIIADTVLPPDSAIQSLTNLIALPLSYGLEFGAFLIGTLAFWRDGALSRPRSELAVLLALAALASLLIGSFLRSSVLFNDLGWRVMLFAQLAALLWTLAALRASFALRPSPVLGGSRRAALGFLACMGLSFVGEAYGMVQYRRNSVMTAEEIALLPQERAAWDWLDRNLPAGTVVQGRPDPTRNRAFGYGLYGRFRTAVSDPYNGILFGAARQEVAARIARLSPIFADPSLTLSEAMGRAASAGVDVLVVTALDPVFAAPGAWPRAATPRHANAGVMLFAVPPAARAP